MDMLEEKGVQIVDSMFWWLNRRRPFIVNNEYKIDLLEVDKKRNTAKILITNLKTNSQTVIEESDEDGTKQTV
jgi:hypothetical protein